MLKPDAIYPQNVLNKIRWTPRMSFKDVEVWYIHRGAPENTRKVDGSQIQSLGSSFFELVPCGFELSTSIPYHRVLRIDYKGKTYFKKKMRVCMGIGQKISN